MGKSSGAGPTVPDPNLTARSQTVSDIKLANAQALLNNINEVTPYGTVNYRQVGSHNVAGGTVPIIRREQTLNATQQGLLNQQNALAKQLNSLGISQATRIGNTLKSPINTAALTPARQTAANLGQLSQAATAPTLQNVSLNNVAAGGNIRNTADTQTAQTTLANAGNIQTALPNSDYAAQRTAVENAIYSRLNPQLQQDRDALSTKLINQGFQVGSEGYNREMDAYNRQANDARMQAVLAGGQEQSRLAGLDLNAGNFANSAQQQKFNQNLGAGQFQQQGAQINNAQQLALANLFNQAQAQGFEQESQRTMANNQIAQQQAGFNNQNAQQNFQNQQTRNDFNNSRQMDIYNAAMQNAAFNNNSRQQGLQEQLAVRNQGINEIAALMSGGQVTMPQFAQYNPAQIARSPVAQSAYQSAALQNQYNQQQQSQQNAMLGGLFGLGQAGIMGGLFSDRRLKRDIADLGVRLANGLKLYAYRYAWEAKRRVGVMADEVASVVPAALGSVGGFATVDYDRVVRA